MSLLRERVLTALVYGDIPEPVELTQTVARVIDEDLRDLLGWIEATSTPEREVQVAVVTGVLIHTATGDWFQAHGPRIHSTVTGERPLAL